MKTYKVRLFIEEEIEAEAEDEAENLFFEKLVTPEFFPLDVAISENLSIEEM